MPEFYIGSEFIFDPDKKLEKIELTQAEYDALEEKQENMLYIITDSINPLIEIDERISDIEINHVASKDNPHEVTKEQIGLSNVDNTSDINKPISSATQRVLDLKANVTDLSNVIADEVVNLPDISEVDLQTRGEIKKDLFDDLWLKAVYDWGSIDHTHVEDEITKPYMCNEVWMTYDEAVTAYIYGNNPYGVNYTRFGTQPKIKTNLPIIGISLNHTRNLNNLFEGQDELEVCNLTGVSIDYLPMVHNSYYLARIFNGCSSLRKIIGTISMTNVTQSTDVFKGCSLLEEVRIKYLQHNLTIPNSPKLSYDSLLYIVQQSSNGTKEITITVHPDIYAKLLGDTTNETVAALTSAELTKWANLLTTAINKKISFATE